MAKEPAYAIIAGHGKEDWLALFKTRSVPARRRYS